ncbi:adenosylhomocysteinase-like [Cajanus cajan]|uniref:adenosylhomocysteinase-like n=1 Tax=Cajanus cajan TaxID=3821 RepID=UPI00098DBDF6|nr:adenosylhomocysteinase-like [Cajanus cajan]
MALLVEVKDISQADFGRLELDLAEVEMPGLMACRAEFGPSQPFKGARITRSLHMTIQTAVFAWKGERLQEYWWCTERALDWCPGGDATLLIHEGVKAEELYEKTGQLPDPASTDNAEFQIVLTIIRDGYRKMKNRLVGVSEETTTGVKRLYQMQANGTLLFPAINVNDSVTKSKLARWPMSSKPPPTNDHKSKATGSKKPDLSGNSKGSGKGSGSGSGSGSGKGSGSSSGTGNKKK